MVTESQVEEFITGPAAALPADVAAMLRRAAELHPDRRIIYPTPRGEHVRTYRETFEEACRILGGMQASGLRPGDIVVVALEEPQDFIPCLWACVLGGIVPCPIIPKVTNMDLWTGGLDHLSGLFDGPAFIAEGRNRGLFADRRFLPLDDLRRGPGSVALLHDSRSDDVAFLMLSSGSTGAPKAIALSHGNILASMEGKRLATGITGADVTMNWIAFDHVAALTECHLLPIYTGSTQVQISPVEVASDPLYFLETISRHRVTHTFTPNFLLGQIVAQAEAGSRAHERINALDLSCLDRIISGGEANVCATGARFLDVFAAQGMKRTVLWPAFGMTETCAGSIYSTIFPQEINTHEFASLGWPVQGLELRIQGDDGRTARAGEEGELQLRGAMIFGEYHANSEATADAFTDDGWFRTGDLGVVEPDTGSLRLVGRSKDSIIVNGINYFLHELESAIGSLDGVAPSFVTCFPTRPRGSDTEALVVLYSPLDAHASAGQLRATGLAIRNLTVLHWGFRPALVLPVDEDVLTKTSLGKIQRSKLRKDYEAGAFDDRISALAASEAKLAPPRMPPATENEARAIKAFSRITGIADDDIGATSNFFSLGGTSLEILQLLAAVNALSQAEGNIALVDLIRDPTPRGIAALLEKNSGEEPSYDPVVPLQSHGDKSPVFFIHPGVGEVLVFVNVANFFTDERPIYALRARGFNPGETFFGSFDELVTVYVDAIRARQEHGPYILAGYSYGGPASLPIAQRLEAMDEQVHLVVIDAPPVIEHPRGEVDRIESALMLSFFLGFIDKHEVDEYGQALREEPGLDPAEYLFTRAPAVRIRELGQDLASFRHWNELAYGLSQIGIPYRPSGTVSDVTVLYAQPIWGDKDEYLTTMLRKWDQYSRDAVRYVEVPGEHHTLLGPEHADKFQYVLKAELTRIEGESRLRP
jgi:putative peptide synthase protein